MGRRKQQEGRRTFVKLRGMQQLPVALRTEQMHKQSVFSFGTVFLDIFGSPFLAQRPPLGHTPCPHPRFLP